MKKSITLLLTFLYSYSIYAILPKSSYALPAYSKSTNKHEQIIEYERYTVSYNKKYRIPNWVAWELVEEHTKGPGDRINSLFKEDVNVGSPTTKEYYGEHQEPKGKYHRGHMCPSADNKWDQKIMNESFYTTNICPQTVELNDKAWGALEDRCRKWCTEYEKIYIVCGPIIKEYSKSKVFIGPNKDIYVPNEFFKAILRVKLDKRGRVIGAESIGFLFTQEGNMRLCSVNYIENLTDFNLFHNLPSWIQEKTEIGYNKNKWDFGKLRRYL